MIRSVRSANGGPHVIKKLIPAAWFGVALAGAACSTGSQSDSDSPVVVITSPKADSTVAGQVPFTAQVFDGFGVAKVVFKVDGAVLGEDRVEPWGVVWSAQGATNGRHSLQVEATDPAGNTGSSSISVTVDNSIK